jgi:hypothetical protein
MLSNAQRPRRKQRAPKLSDAQRQAKYRRTAEVRKHRAELARMEAGVAAERENARIAATWAASHFAGSPDAIDVVVCQALAASGVEANAYSADAVVRQIALTLEILARDQSRFDTRIRELEAEGIRIVDGGPIDDCEWKHTDWRTGEVLARGAYRDYERFEPPGKWYHVDHVYQETVTLDSELVADLPPDFAISLMEWVECNEERAKALVGTPSADPPGPSP